jgi:transposase
MNYRTSIGLDVHARSIKAAAFIPETGEIVEKGFAYDPAQLLSWVETLPKPAQAVYESGPTGFDLARALNKQGLSCKVGAVSKMFKASGDRIKTDRRDAIFLARMLAVGNVVEVFIPSLALEAARDLSRAREDTRKDLMRARHLLSKFLLRKGIAYDKGKTAWTKAHKAWLGSLAFDYEEERLVFASYTEGVAFFECRKASLDKEIARRAALPEYAPLVDALCCLRGVSTVTAFAIATEIGDFMRFPGAKGFMSYLGLVPSEYSTGENIVRGAITRTGNIHLRTLCVESSWHHKRTYRPLSQTSMTAFGKVPGDVVLVAQKANRRLHERYCYLLSRNKKPAVANVAIARELAGFIWAIGRLVQGS